MFIRVVYTDGRHDMVKPELLDYLLGKNKVTKFKRYNGWAVVGNDAIRTGSSNGYCGEERRASPNSYRKEESRAI
ncbi:MAG: hypothetical protein P8Y96_08720 [Desulfuromonadales bacterium]